MLLLRFRKQKRPAATDVWSEAPRPPLPPLVFLVNERSGGGLGADLIRLLATLPDAPRTFPLSTGGLHACVRFLRERRALQPRLVCAGGDGTVTAVVRTLATSGLAHVPVAVLPLGTGNDCARSLSVRMPPLAPAPFRAWLAAAAAAPVVATDLFEVAFDTHPGGAIVCVRDRAETQLSERLVRGTSLNYVSLGLDARLVYTVELHRRRSRLLNQLTYFLAGAYHVFAAWGPPVTARLSHLVLDDVWHVPAAALPRPLASLVCLHIDSYAAGTNLWRYSWTIAPAVYRRMFGYGDGGRGGAGSVGFRIPFEEQQPKAPGSTRAPPCPADLLLSRPAAASSLTHSHAAGGLLLGSGGTAAAASVAQLSPYHEGDAEAAPSTRRHAPPSWPVRAALCLTRAVRRLCTSPTTAGAQWQQQSRDDGVCELIGLRSLFQEGGLVGTKCALFGGAYRLAQPRAVAFHFHCPPQTQQTPQLLLPQLPVALPSSGALSTTSAARDSDADKVTAATSSPLAAPLSFSSAATSHSGFFAEEEQPAVHLSVNAGVGAASPPPQPGRHRTGSSFSPLAAALTERRGRKQAVLAPPETVGEQDLAGNDDDDAGSLCSDGGDGGAAGAATLSVSDASPGRSSFASPSVHSCAPRGYALVPRGAISGDASGGREGPGFGAGTASALYERGSLESVGGTSKGVGAAATPPKLAIAMPLGEAAAAVDPRSLPFPSASPASEAAAAHVGMRFRRVTLAATDASVEPGDEIESIETATGSVPANRSVVEPALLSLTDAVGVSPAVTAAPTALQHAHVASDSAAENASAAAAAVVTQGGAFADSEPTFLQVDGEGYKVFGLRQLSVRFKARVAMVSFRGCDS